MKGTDRPEHLQQAPRRRILSLSAGALATGLAGCTGSEFNETEPDTTTASNTSESPTETFAGGVQLENIHASNIRIGQESQAVNVRLSGSEPGAETDLYVELTSLAEANINAQDLSVVAETSSTSNGWVVSDAEITETDGILVRVSVEIMDTNADAIEDVATVDIDVNSLNTDDAEPMEGLEHSATLSAPNGEPDFTTGATGTYDIIDPENVLQVRTSDIRVGETSQQVDIVVERATNEIAFRLDLTPITEVGVDISGADVVVDETSGERRNDDGEVEIEVTEATVMDHIFQLGITTTADTLAVEIRITGLNTEGAEATGEITYPVYSGERPSDPAESYPFSISGAIA